ncbi:MAG: hypothetical protein DDG60_15020 [Anaerolineae bacterium]|nr:MAG: hypothetical protein DDG60_15020 [Anaerolineae bacterium]
MSDKIRRFLLAASLTYLLLPWAWVHAQGTASILLFQPDASQFPTITALLDVFDEQGRFVTGLSAAEVSVLENGEMLGAPSVFEQLPQPLRVIVAINAGPALAIRDGVGLSRYDKTTTVLKNWIASQPANGNDDFALVWNGGIVGSQLSARDWLARFEKFDPALRNSTPGLTALAFALDVAQQSTVEPGSKKVIFFISPHLENRDLSALPDLLTRAQQAGVRIFIWLVDSPDYFNHSGAQALFNLANQTRGQSLTFSGTETLPDPEELVASLRYVYRLAYQSAVRESGQHSLTVLVNGGGLQLTSNPVPFQIQIEPPNPVLLSPPVQIVRQNLVDQFDIENSLPKTQEIRIIIEFNDNIKRSLARTTLYVDGAIADENTAPPFDKFDWDLSAYLVSGEHQIQVEAVDTLGLSKMSAIVPIQVVVIQPPGGVWGLILRNRGAVTVSVIIAAGMVLLGILFFSGRKTLNALAERRRIRALHLDPVTQPVFTGEPSASRSNPFPWLKRKTAAPIAYFVKLTLDGQPAAGDPIPLTGRELTFGTDPTQATNVLDHPSLSPLHARLRQDENGNFILQDQNSVAGTWVNYELAPKDGWTLRHGDVIHFGELTYRFIFTKPPAAKKPIVTSLTTDDSH